MMRIITKSFFDGFGAGALFVRPKRSGAPTRVFASQDDFALLERRYEELLGSLQAELPADFLQFRPSKLKITAFERELLGLASRHPSILTLAATLAETPDNICTMLARLYDRLATRRPHSSRAASAELAHRETKA